MSYMDRQHSFTPASRAAAILPEHAPELARRLHDSATRGRARWGAWRRFGDWISELRVRRGDRLVALYIQGRGGCLTDAVEREVMDQLTS
jgi:hypothetical protein